MTLLQNKTMFKKIKMGNNNLVRKINKNGGANIDKAKSMYGITNNKY